MAISSSSSMPSGIGVRVQPPRARSHTANLLINRAFWRFTATRSAPQIDSRPIAGHGTDSSPNLAREAGAGFPGGFLRGSIWRHLQQRVRGNLG